ncbi:MAG: chorismate-binding protein, partial [Pseudomonadota bacterium]
MKEDNETYLTRGGVKVVRSRQKVDFATAIESATDALDDRMGAVLSSNYEYPGRYTRWDTAIIDPPLMISARKRIMKVTPLNARGVPLAAMVRTALQDHPHIDEMRADGDGLRIIISEQTEIVSEEERSRAPSVFSILRTIVQHFGSSEDEDLALFGAFGYDIAFQFDPIEEKLERPEDQRDLVLFFPDQIIVVDNHSADAWVDVYDFNDETNTTVGIEREQTLAPFVPTDEKPPRGDHVPGEYAKLVEKAKDSFARGDLFEVAPGQKFFERVASKPSAIAKRLKETNPAPYSFFMNLGENEFLIGASPEMFVRVTGRRIETCPISGTIERGTDAIT